MNGIPIRIVILSGNPQQTQWGTEIVSVAKTNKGLVAGASGLLGVAAIEKFLSLGWEVIGVSRRKPELPSGR
jgi:hypothetical protein